MGKKMYYVLRIIQDNDVISAKDIVVQLESYDIYVDIKSVYRIIKRINEFFEHWIQGQLIRTLKKKGYTIGKELFSDGELQFLLDSIMYHHDLNNDDQKNLKDKLMFLSSVSQQDNIISSLPQLKHQSFSLIHNLTTIMKSIQQHKMISFQYIDYDIINNQPIEISAHSGQNYYISPYQIVLNNNHYYLIGYNTIHKDTLSTYRIDRMRQIHTTKNRFIEIREQFDMQEEVNQMMNMFTSQRKDTLVIQCQHKLLREIVSRFGFEIYVEKLYHDEYVITIDNVSISEGLIGWIMMLQNQIKVLAPSTLKQTIKERIKLMETLYEDVL